MKFRAVEGWGRLPEGWSFVEATSVAVDAHDNVVVFNRGAHPVIVFDRDGNFLTSWGEGLFNWPHGLTYGPDDTLYCTDGGDHTVRKCTLDGKVLLTLGMPGKESPAHSGRPFNRCTHVALDPRNGDLFVSDGYCNSSIHKFTPDGKLLHSWGEPGTDPGQFNIPHNLCTDSDGYVYVADRDNHRIQVFDRQGRFEKQLVNLHMPCALFLRHEAEDLLYLGELGPNATWKYKVPNTGPRVGIHRTDGSLVARLGGTSYSEDLGSFIAPHGIAVDSCGDVYVAEVSWGVYGQFQNPPRRDLRTLQKLVRQDGSSP